LVRANIERERPVKVFIPFNKREPLPPDVVPDPHNGNGGDDEDPEDQLTACQSAPVLPSPIGYADRVRKPQLSDPIFVTVPPIRATTHCTL
jgi:hypothetical protein